MILENGLDPHARPAAPDPARAGDRRRPDRRRRRRPRDGAPLARGRRPRRPGRRARARRRARPLPDLGARASARSRSTAARSLAEALARVARGAAPGGGSIRGYGWRSERLADGDEPTAAAARRGHRRHARRADLEGLPLALAQLGGARAAPAATSRSRAASSSATPAASRPASCARRRRGASSERHLAVPDDGVRSTAMRAGLRLAAARGRHRGARQGRLARRARALAAARAAGVAHAAGLAVAPGRAGRRSCAELGHPLRLRRARCSRLGYLKVFMDGTLGSRTALMLDGSRRADHERRGARGDRRARRARRASRSRCTRSATARTARRSTPSSATRDALGAARPAPADRARPAARARGPPPLRASSASPARCSSRTRPPTATSPTASGPRRSTAPTPTARCSTRARCVANGSDAPIEELDPLAGIRAGVRRSDRRAAALASRAGADRRAGVRRRRRVAPAWLEGRRAPRAAGCSPATPPTSSCSTATPGDDLDAAGRRDDGRRALGAQPAALGLRPPAPAQQRRRSAR